MNDASASPDHDHDTGELVFADLGLRAELLAALDDLGYEEPTPIQSEAVPPLLEGRDLVGQPCLWRLFRQSRRLHPRALRGSECLQDSRRCSR